MKEEIKSKINCLRVYAEIMDGVYLNDIENYITNLEQIEQEHKKINGNLREDNKKLEEKIDKAIEYINADYINGKIDGLSWLETQKLLNILKGGDE